MPGLNEVIGVAVAIAGGFLLYQASSETVPAGGLLAFYVMRLPFPVTSPMYNPLMCAIFVATVWLAWDTRAKLRDANRNISKLVLGLMVWAFITSSAMLAVKPLGASVIDLLFTFIVTLTPVGVYAFHLLVVMSPQAVSQRKQKELAPALD